MFRDPGWPNMTSNIVPVWMPQESSKRSAGVSRLHPAKGDSAVNPAARRRRSGAAHVCPCLGRSDTWGVSLAQAPILLMTGLTALNAREIAAG